MNTLFILLGGNIGDRKNNLQRSLTFVKEEIGQVVRSSMIYETEAWGNNDQPDFYNQVHIINTKFSASETMERILAIEAKMGRIRTTKNAERIIDIDILFFNKEIINEPDLKIPHPEIANRRFVLVPLNELSPEFIHPLLNTTIRELLSTCKDMLEVTPVPDL